MTNPTLVSIQVSPPRSFGTEGATDPMERPWTTGFYKEPVPAIYGPSGDVKWDEADPTYTLEAKRGG